MALTRATGLHNGLPYDPPLKKELSRATYSQTKMAEATKGITGETEDKLYSRLMFWRHTVNQQLSSWRPIIWNSGKVKLFSAHCTFSARQWRVRWKNDHSLTFRHTDNSVQVQYDGPEENAST